MIRFSGVSLRYGVEDTTFEGVPARITNPARTVVDCFRFPHFVGMDGALEALRDALEDRKASPQRDLARGGSVPREVDRPSGPEDGPGMTPKRQIRDFPASVRQRLQNLAREQDLDFQRVLDRYTGERFLYRLSASDEVDRFVLKGAALFRIWFATEQRPTRDLDFLATGPENQAAIRAALEAICRVPCPEDGVAAHRDRGDFRRRATAFAGETPVACSRATAKTTARAERWQELQRRIGTGPDGSVRLLDAGRELRRFLGPVCDSLIQGIPFTQAWPAGGPWQAGIQARRAGRRR